MNEDFVSKELTRKLKEKGYPLEKVFVSDGRPVLYDLPTSDPNWFKCDAWYIPTIAGVLKWLREEKGLLVFARPDNYMIGFYNYEIFDVKEWNYEANTGRYKSYEEAVIAGIERVLDNLI